MVTTRTEIPSPSPKPDATLSDASARRISYTLKLITGTATGLYLFTYLAVIDVALAPALTLRPGVAGLLALAFCFVLEYFLDVPGGVEGQVRGERQTFVISFALRASFMLLVAFMSLFVLPGVAVVAMTALAMAAFAAAYSTFSGNYEKWLIGLCPNKAQGRAAFALSESYFYGGVIGGGSLAVFIPSTPAYLAAACMCLVAAGVCYKIPAPPPKTNKVAGPVSRKDIALQAQADLARLPFLDRSFNVSAMAYGLSTSLDAIVPMVYLLTKEFSFAKFLTLVVCLWLPSLLGSLSLLATKPSGGTTSISLRRTLFAFCGGCCLLPLTMLLPASVSFALFGVVLLATRLAQGRLFPQIQEFNSRIANDESRVVSTLMSIGERRKKIGAIVALLIPAAGGVFKSVGPSAFYWGLGLFAASLAIYANFALRGQVESGEPADLQEPISPELLEAESEETYQATMSAPSSLETVPVPEI